MFNQRLHTRNSDARRIREEAADLDALRPHLNHLNNGEQEGSRARKLVWHSNSRDPMPKQSQCYLRRASIKVSIDGYAARSIQPREFRAGLYQVNAMIPDGLTAGEISSKASGEIGEAYWMAVVRDVNFRGCSTNTLAGSAANSSTNEFSVFRGPGIGGSVVPETLFRGFTPGELAGALTQLQRASICSLLAQSL